MPVLSPDRFGAASIPSARSSDRSKAKRRASATNASGSHKQNRHVGPWAKLPEPVPEEESKDASVPFQWHRRRLEPSKAVKPASNLPTSARRRTLPEEEDMHEIIQAYTKMALERTDCIQELTQKRVLPHSKKRPPSAQQRVYMPTSRIRRAVQSAGVQRTVPVQPSLVRIRVFSSVPTATTAAATPPNHALVAPIINSAATTTTRHATPARMLPPRCMSAKPRRRSEVTAPRPQSAHPRSSVPAVINRPTVEVAENGKMKLTVHMTHIRMENNDGDDDAADEEVEGDD